jgi:hypothetical protein
VGILEKNMEHKYLLERMEGCEIEITRVINLESGTVKFDLIFYKKEKEDSSKIASILSGLGKTLAIPVSPDVPFTITQLPTFIEHCFNVFKEFLLVSDDHESKRSN